VKEGRQGKKAIRSGMAKRGEKADIDRIWREDLLI